MKLLMLLSNVPVQSFALRSYTMHDLRSQHISIG